MRQRMVHISFAVKSDYRSIDEWLSRIDFYTPILDAIQQEIDVFHLDMISFESHTIRNGVHYYCIQPSHFSPWFPFRLIRLAESLGSDVIVIHGLSFPLQTLMLRWMVPRKVKLWIQHHADRPLRFRGVLQKAMDRCVDRYLFSTRALAVDWIESKIIASPEKIIEVMGVTAAYQFNCLGPRQGEKRLSYIWVGQFDSNKDPDTLLQAFISFIKTTPQAILYLIFTNKNWVEEIELRVKGFEENIRLIGAVEREAMNTWFGQVNFIISTSRYEANGAAVCEAMACGCIPILSEIPAFKMMTQQGNCGFFFNPGDPDSLLLALKKSEGIQLDEERSKVLDQFQKNLSSHAIASKVIAALKDQAGPNRVISIV